MNNTKNAVQDTVLEMVSYKIKSDHLAVLPDSLDAARKELENMEGFVSYKTMKSAKHSRTFIDVVEWENLEAAENAASKVMQTSGFKKFSEAIEEVITFNHFNFYH